MSYTSPKNVTETTKSIAVGQAFQSRATRLSGHRVHVLSTPNTLGDSLLNDYVRIRMAEYRAAYLLTGTRVPSPGMVVYYVQRAGHVVLAVTASGEVLEDLGGIGSTRTIQSYKDAAQEYAVLAVAARERLELEESAR